MIVYHSMLSSFISYATVLVRPDDPGTDRGSLCLRACSSVLLIHPKGGRPGGTRVVTSYMSVVLGYVGSFGYDHAPRCDWGRRQVVTTLSVRRNNGVEFRVLPDIRVRCTLALSGAVAIKPVVTLGITNKYHLTIFEGCPA